MSAEEDSREVVEVFTAADDIDAGSHLGQAHLKTLAAGKCGDQSHAVIAESGTGVTEVFADVPLRV